MDSGNSQKTKKIRKVRFKDSIGLKLITIVFCVYFCITLVATIATDDVLKNLVET